MSPVGGIAIRFFRPPTRVALYLSYPRWSPSSDTKPRDSCRVGALRIQPDLRDALDVRVTIHGLNVFGECPLRSLVVHQLALVWVCLWIYCNLPVNQLFTPYRGSKTISDLSHLQWALGIQHTCCIGPEPANS